MTRIIKIDSPENADVILIPDQTNQWIAENVLQARSGKFITRTSRIKPNSTSVPLSQLSISSLMEVAQYCDDCARVTLSTVSKFFYRLIQTSRTTATLKCRSGWVETINRSPMIESISLLDDSDEEDMKRFCTIIRNDGFPSLRSVNLFYISDRSIHLILSALSEHSSHLNRMQLSSRKTISFSLQTYYLSPSISYSFQEALTRGLSSTLQSLSLSTDDIEGLVQFFKVVDLSDCRYLDSIFVDSCPLQVRCFELLIRSVWPNNGVCSNHIPIRILSFSNIQLEDCGIKSLGAIARRNSLINLEKLDISNNKLSRDSITNITGLLSSYLCPNLHRLILTNNALGVGSLVDFFRSLANGCCVMLSVLEIENTGIGVEDIYAFAEYLQSPFSENLSRINLSSNPLITSALSAFFKALCESPCQSINTLFLEGVSFSMNEVSSLITWMLGGKAKKLKNLILKSNLLDGEAFRLLLSAMIQSDCPRLKVIDFSGNLIGNLDRERWKQLINSKGEYVNFEQVDYSFNPLTDNDMRLLLQFMSRFSHLEDSSRITFCSNAITAKSIHWYFSSLMSVDSSLHYLAIDSCNLAGCGKPFYKFLTSPAARYLGILLLRDCNLTRNDLFSLCDAFEQDACVSLSYLQLDGNSKVDDLFLSRFLETLSNSHLSNLTDIEFAYTSITVNGFKELLKYLQGHPYTLLSRINFCKTKVSTKERNTYKALVSSVFRGYFSI